MSAPSGIEPGDQEPAEAGGYRPVTSVSRTIDVLEALAASTEPYTLGTLARRLGIPRSTLHGILRTLEHRRWVETDGSGVRFRIGAGSLQVGSSYLDSDKLLARTAPLLDQLADATGESVQLARLDGADVIYLARRRSPHPVQLVSTVGRRLPAHATALGKALLAQYPAEDVDRRLPRRLGQLTDRTVTSRRDLRRQLDTIRSRGWALDDEEAADGLRCFAVALPTSRPPIDAISISAPTFRLTSAVEEQIVHALLEAREAMTTRAV